MSALSSRLTNKSGPHTTVVYNRGLDHDVPMRHDSYEKVFRGQQRSSVAMTEDEKLKSENMSN